jgi:hypothetical protein
MIVVVDAVFTSGSLLAAFLLAPPTDQATRLDAMGECSLLCLVGVDVLHGRVWGW